MVDEIMEPVSDMADHDHAMNRTHHRAQSTLDYAAQNL